jgi:branched-chain amino acid transport system substrate-binding protein
MIGGDGWESAKLFELGGTPSTAAYVLEPLLGRRPVARASRKYIEKYKAAYGSEPDSLAALGYDSAMVAIDAMKRAPADGPALRDAIARRRTSPAWRAPSPSTRTATPVKPAVMLQVAEGKLKYVNVTRDLRRAR